MRRILIALLLAGVAATPALADPQDDHGRWHRNDQNNGGGQHDQGSRGGHNDHPQLTPPPQQVDHRPPVIVQQGHAFQHPQFATPPQQMNHRPPVIVQQQQVQTTQAYRHGGYRGGYDGRVQQPQQVTNQDWSRQRGTWNGQRNWNGENGARNGQRNWNGQNGYYGQQRQVIVPQQYRNGNRYAYRGGGAWNREWRNDRRYDWRRYRDQHRSIFQVGIYYDPFGYGYQPFNVGFQLMPAYYGQQYWLDPAMYDLPFPPPGAQWVRYWNDALLVDMYSGQVIDVIHGFFW